MKNELSIDNMVKVSLNIWIGPAEEKIDDTISPATATFIFGIGASGLTDFEYLLAGKKAGNKIILKVNPTDVHGMFSHLACEFRDIWADLQTDTWMMVKVADVKQADNREIVKAMAGGNSCGGGCDCGCGC